MTKIRRFVVYGYPWFTTTLEDAVTINVEEKVGTSTPHLSIKESFEQFWRDESRNRRGYW